LNVGSVGFIQVFGDLFGDHCLHRWNGKNYHNKQ